MSKIVPYVSRRMYRDGAAAPIGFRELVEVKQITLDEATLEKRVAQYKLLLNQSGGILQKSWWNFAANVEAIEYICDSDPDRLAWDTVGSSLTQQRSVETYRTVKDILSQPNLLSLKIDGVEQLSTSPSAIVISPNRFCRARVIPFSALETCRVQLESLDWNSSYWEEIHPANQLYDCFCDQLESISFLEGEQEEQALMKKIEQISPAISISESLLHQCTDPIVAEWMSQKLIHPKRLLWSLQSDLKMCQEWLEEEYEYEDDEVAHA